jgi:uncharacterized protein YprB with RNaseH-like and TPR domain
VSERGAMTKSKLVDLQKIDPNRLTKEQILFLWNHRCRTHSQRFLAHPECFYREYPEGAGLLKPEKIGFLDIEATSLNASFGYMICYCIQPYRGKMISRSIVPQDILSFNFDKNLIVQFVLDIQGFDRLVGYYSKDYRYDIPFLRTRALKWGVSFPAYKEFMFSDCYDLVKKKLKLHRSRLENACDLLEIPSKGHRLNPSIWMKSQAGDQASLDYILKHCKEDVISLRAVWTKLWEFDRISRTSM